MPLYIILSRISPESFETPRDFKLIAQKVSSRLQTECPGVKIRESFACLGRFDFVDVVEAETPEQVEKASMLIRSVGHSTTETMQAIPWSEFLESL
jgi:uncharacterized protein with GYD domain